MLRKLQKKPSRTQKDSSSSSAPSKRAKLLTAEGWRRLMMKKYRQS